MPTINIEVFFLLKHDNNDLTLSCGREILAICHSTVSPDHMNVPAFAPDAGDVDQDILSFVTVLFARLLKIINVMSGSATRHQTYAST
jgi:hypothetical protein